MIATGIPSHTTRDKNSSSERKQAADRRAQVQKEDKQRQETIQGRSFARMTMPAITVRRSAPDLVVPARPTPYELKTLSDIDDQQGIRFYRSGVHIYRRSDARAGDDPAAVLRTALAEALVHYYPIAGRIREVTPGDAGSKLLVECTGEGAVFVEADADATLEDLGAVTGPPVPCHEQFLCEPDGAFIGATVVGRPLLFFQVTRMRCGGFVWGLQICHCLADAAGTSQLLTAISEFARGVPDAPTVPPVWARDILSARSPPQAITRHHPEYEPVPDAGRDKVYPGDALVHRNFFFGHREIAALRALATPELASKSSRFDLIAAFIWRCRANALMYDDEELVRVQFVVNARGRKGMSLVVPQGFYGNAFSFAVAESAAGELRRRTYGYALRLVVDAKAYAMEDGHLQSVVDLMVARGRPRFAVARTYVVSDITRAGLRDVDVGWGRAVYGGPATATLATFHLAGRNEAGEEGVLVPMRLPAPAMEKLKLEVASGLGVIGADAPAGCSLSEIGFQKLIQA
uniref:Uncharacterized protein n=1 Tax=Avena sativa TaxID=4498 RepID=A0ACD5TWF2_AVESA